MNIKQLKELIKDQPDDLPVEVNIVDQGQYYSDDISAFIYEDNKYPCDRAFVITVGDSE